MKHERRCLVGSLLVLLALKSCIGFAEAGDQKAADLPKGRIVLDVMPKPDLTGGGPGFAIRSRSVAIGPKTIVFITGVTSPNSAPDPSSIVPSRCLISLSNDGGLTWDSTSPWPIAGDSKVTADCAAPVAVAASDGTLYAAAETSKALQHSAAAGGLETVVLNSSDGGKTWNKPVNPWAGSDNAALRRRGLAAPAVAALQDRPFLGVGTASGDLYLASAGRGQRMITVSHDQGKTWSLPESPVCDEMKPASAPPAGMASTISLKVVCSGYPMTADSAFGVANGMIAALYRSGPPAKPIKAGTLSPSDGCDKPCWVFATSENDGQHWLRKPLDLQAGGPIPFIAADPHRRGGFALMVPNSDGTGLQIMITRDGGESWNAAGLISASAKDRKIVLPELAYSARDVLGVIWREVPAGRSSGHGGQDIVSVISQDRGKTFSTPLKLNALALPEPRPWPAIIPASDRSGLVIEDGYLYGAWNQYDDGQPHNVSHSWFARIPLSDYSFLGR